jgi:hypothetical protein
MTTTTTRHIHQDLIDLYQEGQVWQHRYSANDDWVDTTFHSFTCEPKWEEDMQYRLHPHNDLIQAYNKGMKIQYKRLGNWIDTTSPNWDIGTEYRIKPPYIPSWW